MDDLNDLIWTTSDKKTTQNNQHTFSTNNAYNRAANYSPTTAFKFPTSPQSTNPNVNTNKYNEIDPFAGLVSFQKNSNSITKNTSLNQHQPLRSNSLHSNTTYKNITSSNNKFGSMNSIPMTSNNSNNAFSDFDLSFFDNLSSPKPQPKVSDLFPTTNSNYTFAQDDPFDLLLSSTKPQPVKPIEIKIDLVDNKLDEKLAELVDQGYELDAVKVALSMTEENDVLEAKSILDENRKVEDQAAIHKLQPNPSKFGFSQTPDYSDEDDDDNVGFLGSKSTSAPTKSTSDTKEAKAIISSLFDEEVTRSSSPAKSDVSNSKLSEGLSSNKEEFINQASDIGSSMFTAASALFSRSKQTLQQTWGEIKTSSNASSRASTPNQAKSKNKSSSGKSKEDMDSDDDYGYTYKSNYHNFKSQDSDDEVTLNTDLKNKNLKAQSISSKGSTPRTCSPRSEPVVEAKPVLPPRSMPSPQPVPIDEAHADLNQIENAESLRHEGNKQFKLGQFTDAETYYNKAIEQLPSNHPNLIVLLNNRATSKSKNGDNKGAFSDANQALQLIGPTFMKYKPNPDNLQGGLKAKINLHDQASKALLRKAHAAEALENFEVAGVTYQQLLTYQLNNNLHGQVMQGIRRCKGTTRQPVEKLKSTQGAKPKIETNKIDDMFSEFDTLTFSSNQVDLTPKYNRELADRSKAVQNLRAKDQQAANEEKVRLQIVDEMHAELNQWKQGKEDNLRALLASIDTLLWAELEWKPVNLGHLVTTTQVKKNYMKAISKLHPDKLKGNVSVKHKLIAENVFATLNLAWDSFKVQNQI